MKIGIVPINVGVFEPEQVAELARKAEAVGAESVWTFEHVIVPVDYASRYPYSSSGKMPATPETPFVDPLIALSHAAAVTQRIRLGTGINILPQANPLLLAKQVASIDFLSNGRMMLGVGIGWLREEFEALGVPFEHRGARFDDYVTAIKKAWSGDVVQHQSDFIAWRDFKSYPLPVQKPHLPIIVGGSSTQALRRVVAHGDGWYAPSGKLDHLKTMLTELRSVAHEAGRAFESIEISAAFNYAAEGKDGVAKYRDLGVSRLIIPTFMLEGGPLAGLDRLGDELIAKL
jgi:probable F420-dependent oxidoreductase